MKYVLLIISLLPFSLFGQAIFELPNKVDVQHYDFKVSIDSKNASIDMVATIELKFTEPEITTILLNLDDVNKDGTGMTINSVNIGNKEVSFTHENDVVKIERLDNKSTTAKVEIKYSGKPADGLIFKENKFGQQTIFADHWPNRAQHWLAVVDHPSDKATVAFEVTAPKKFIIIANGLQQKSPNQNGKLVTYFWKTKVAIPTKVMVIGLADFEIIEGGKRGDIEINSWVYKKNKAEGAIDFDSVLPTYDFFVDYIGSYPYEKLAHVQSTTKYGGMENAGNIFYDEKLVTGRRTFENTIAHETAHQWFGNSVSEDNWHHIWLSEGFATYMTMLYMEHTYGQAGIQKELENAKIKVINFALKNPTSSVVDTTITVLSDLLSANSYQKGAWFLHMLRLKVGDDIFRNSIREYYATFRDKNALTSDFQKIVTTLYGKPLDQFFEQWLYRPGLPQVDWSWDISTYDSDMIAVKLKQNQPLRYEDINLNMDIYLKGVAEPIRKNVDIIYNTKEYSFRVAGEVEKIVLNPDNRVLIIENYMGK
jgi:aminopeptidase N